MGVWTTLQEPFLTSRLPHQATAVDGQPQGADARCGSSRSLRGPEVVHEVQK